MLCVYMYVMCVYVCSPYAYVIHASPLAFPDFYLYTSYKTSSLMTLHIQIPGQGEQSPGASPVSPSIQYIDYVAYITGFASGVLARILESAHTHTYIQEDVERKKWRRQTTKLIDDLQRS